MTKELEEKQSLRHVAKIVGLITPEVLAVLIYTIGQQPQDDLKAYSLLVDLLGSSLATMVKWHFTDIALGPGVAGAIPSIWGVILAFEFLVKGKLKSSENRKLVETALLCLSVLSTLLFCCLFYLAEFTQMNPEYVEHLNAQFPESPTALGDYTDAFIFAVPVVATVGYIAFHSLRSIKSARS